MLFDATGAFNPVTLSNPTDLAGLLRREGNKFAADTAAEIVRNSPRYTTYRKEYALLKDEVNRAIYDYLAKNYPNYNQLDIQQRLVFPGTIKFEYINGEVKIIEKR